MEQLEPAQLSELERVLLTVLAAGLAPSSIAGDPSFRLDVLCARTLALLRAEPPEQYLSSENQATPEFQRDLTAGIHGLMDRRILAAGGGDATAFLALEGEPAPVVASAGPVDFTTFPTVFDRYLAGRCLDELLRNTEVYRYIMGKYADSTEIWQRAARQGR
jgi:hypothetical protein